MHFSFLWRIGRHTDLGSRVREHNVDYKYIILFEKDLRIAQVIEMREVFSIPHSVQWHKTLYIQMMYIIMRAKIHSRQKYVVRYMY